MDIKTYLTRENITLAIAVFGAVLSFITAICNRYNNKKKLKIYVPASFCADCNNGYSFLIMEIINCSRLPIVITRIQAKINNEYCELGQESVRMFEYSYPQRKGRVADDSVLLPISVDTLGYKKILLSVDSIPKITNKEIKFSISTNRGKIRKKVEISKMLTDTKEMLKHMG